ncbi:MAG: hypothetical protein HYV95_14130 [Opitutae bacterium]|nr:hypothetical protein [Opitutae bacterium]
MNRVMLLLALGATVLPPARANHEAGEYCPDGPHVILYEKSDFRGGAIVLHPGESLDNLEHVNFDNGRRANDRVSSIRVERGAEARLFLDARYRGDVLRVTRDVRNLADLGLLDRPLSWNDQISSVRVEGRRPEHGPERGPGDGGRPGWSGGDPTKIVRRAYQDILQRAPDESGLRSFRSRMIDQGWTEQMVRDALRRSEEYRGPVVNAMIARAYRDLLGREPDARGLDHYRNQIIDKGMSEEDMRNDIRRGAEYRNRPRTQEPPKDRPSDGHTGHQR